MSIFAQSKRYDLSRSSENNANAKNALIVALVLMVGMLIFPSAIVGGKADAVGSFIADYQTLIAGIMAVAAAYVTVRQMRQDAAREDARHQQNFLSANLPKHLAVTRLMAAVPLQLRNCAVTIKRYSDILPEGAWIPNWNRENLLTFALAVNSAETILKLVESSHFSDCRIYFTAELADQVQHCTSYAQAMVRHVPPDQPVLSLFFSDADTAPDWFADGLSPILIGLSSAAVGLADELDGWKEYVMIEVS